MEEWPNAGYSVTTRYRDPINDVVAMEVVYPQSGVAAEGFQIEFGMTTQGMAVGGLTQCGVGDIREMSRQ